MGGHLVRCNLSISQMVCERERLDIELKSAYEKSYEITNLNPIFYSILETLLRKYYIHFI